MSIDFESKPVYNDDDKYIKTKVKTFEDNINSSFHNKKVPKERISCKFLSIIMLDFVVKSDEKYYPPIFLEECKYAQEKIKFENYIDEESVTLMMMKQNLIMIMINMTNINFLQNTSFISQIRTIHYVNCIIFTHIPKMNSVCISFNINNSNIIKTHSFLH